MTSTIFARLALVFAPFILIPLANSENECQGYMETCIAAINEFNQCMLSNAVPVRMCFNCLKYYRKLTKSFKKLGSAIEKGPKDVIHCADELLSADGLNIIGKSYKNARVIWRKAFCESCFNKHGTKATDVREFEKQFKGLTDCQNQYKNSTCEQCQLLYWNLNERYSLLEDVRDRNICFDIQDKMNRTRAYWTNELVCCGKGVNFISFAAFSSIILSLPFLFYLGCYVVTKLLECRHRTIISRSHTDAPRSSQKRRFARSSKMNNADNDENPDQVEDTAVGEKHRSFIDAKRSKHDLDKSTNFPSVHRIKPK